MKIAMFSAILAGAFTLSSVMAQDAPPQAGGAGAPPSRERNRRMMPYPMDARGPLFAKMLSDADFLKELNLPEEVAKNLTEGLAKLTEKEGNLQGKRRETMRAQAELLAGLLSDRGKSAEEAKKVLEEQEKVQKELNELMIDRLILIRDSLTDEQIKQASELVKEQFEKRRREFMTRRGINGEGPQRGPEGRRMPPPRRGWEGRNGKEPGTAEEKEQKAPPPPQEEVR